MKKPDIDVYENIIGNKVIIIGDNSDEEKIAEAYEEMIDALIEAHGILNSFDEEASNVKADIGNALKKAGVEL